MRKKIALVIIAVVILFVVGHTALRVLNIAPFLYELTFKKDIEVKKESKRLNILLLGVGGGNHEGPNLTDTIIVASISPGNDKITLISLPRDLWISDLEAKINTAYVFGEVKKEGGGITLVQATIEKVTNLAIDYTLKIDFSGFVKAVDLLGGIDVDVENSFDDYEYPIDGKETDPCGHKEEELEDLATASSQLEAFPCRYEHIHFDKGMQYMDGATALKFVRSRHASGNEGTDFARSKRQEKVIKAFKDKVFSLQMFLNPDKFLDLFDVLSDSIDTNIKQEEIDDFIRLVQKLKTAEIKSIALDSGDEKNDREGLLINPISNANYLFEWVLIPRKGVDNYFEIQDYIQCELTKDDCLIEEGTNKDDKSS